MRANNDSCVNSNIPYVVLLIQDLWLTLELVVDVLQQNPDDLDDGEDERAKRQGTCVIPEQGSDEMSITNLESCQDTHICNKASCTYLNTQLG